MASLGFTGPPKNVRSPLLDSKAPGPPLIYLVGPLAISDPKVSHRWGTSQNLMEGGGLSQNMGGSMRAA